MKDRPVIVSQHTCVVCGERVQGRKRADARVCVGKCAQALARQRTKAWKGKQPFSIRKGIMPTDEESNDRSATG